MGESGIGDDGDLKGRERAEFEILARNGLADVAESISSSRIRFSMPLDTAGGPGWYKANLEWIKDCIEGSGGDFAAYGGASVHSFGAKLLMMAPKGLRFAHPLSNILFHLGTPDPRVMLSKREQMENRRESRSEIRDLLLGEATAVHRVDVMRMLNDTLLARKPRTPDRRVVFSGKAAENWGMLNALDAESMAKHLLERHQLSNGALSLDLIRGFFQDLGAYQKESRRQIRKLMEALGMEDKKIMNKNYTQ